MITASSRFLVAVVAVSAALSAQALNIFEGNMNVTTGALSTTSQSPRSFSLKADALATDHGYEHWWYYRIAGDSQEFALRDVGPVTSGVPPHLTHADRDFSDVDNRGQLRANLDMDLYAAGPASGVVTSRVTFTNISASPLVLDVFCYTDLDIGGTFGDDMVTGDGQHHIVTDPTGVRIEVRAPGSDHSDLGAYPSVRTLLTNSVVNNLADNLPPFAGDYTGAFQWQGRTLQPGEQRSFTVVFAIDTAANRVPQVENYGSGSSLTPEIYTDTLPLQDNANTRQMGIYLKNALPNMPFGLLSNISPAPGILFSGLNLWVAPTAPAQFPIGNTNGNGEALYIFVIPPTPYLTGFSIYSQYFYLDTNAPNGIAQSTPAIRTELGKL